MIYFLIAQSVFILLLLTYFQFRYLNLRDAIVKIVRLQTTQQFTQLAKVDLEIARAQLVSSPGKTEIERLISKQLVISINNLLDRK